MPKIEGIEINVEAIAKGVYAMFAERPSSVLRVRDASRDENGIPTHDA
jgi:hypothetical protein